MAHIDNINEDKLNWYDGTDPNLPIVVAIRGKIYVVSNGESFYRSGGSCVVFTGKDASRTLAKMPTKPEDLGADLDGSNRQGDPCT
jgi:membrane-associated progesterone receptor component